MITKDEDYPDAYELQGTRQSTPHLEGYSKDNVLASYLHISFEGNPKDVYKRQFFLLLKGSLLPLQVVSQKHWCAQERDCL